MPYTDGKGRPELLMHPDIIAGGAHWRLEDDTDEPAPDPKKKFTPELIERRRQRRLERLEGLGLAQPEELTGTRDEEEEG